MTSWSLTEQVPHVLPDCTIENHLLGRYPDDGKGNKAKPLAYSPYSQKPLSQIPDRPLIDFITNEWRVNSQCSNVHDNIDKDYVVDEDEYGQFVMSDKHRSDQVYWPVRLPRRPCRYLLLYLFLIGTVVFSCVRLMTRVGREDEVSTQDFYGVGFVDPQNGLTVNSRSAQRILLSYLEKQYVPGATNSGRNRLVIVGDVHGCKKELLDLMKKIEYNQQTDHLIFVGDMIHKGPDSSGVVDFAMSEQASCVRGNHEDRTLLAYASVESVIAKPDKQENQIQDIARPLVKPGTSTIAQSEVEHLKLARQFSNSQLQWLCKCPVILNIGYIKTRNYVVVHAGLAPGIRLEQQNPTDVMNMRSIDTATRLPMKDRTGEAWEKVWNSYQDDLEPDYLRKTVIYGHDSKRGLNMKSYTRGLDTGCVSGGSLTALTIDEKGREKKFSVSCKHHASKEKAG